MVMCFTFLAEQDEGLGKLEETVISTKHIALAVNEELDLHTMLLVESFADFPVYIIMVSFMSNQSCNEDFCSFFNLSFLNNIQDNLDQHVDSTNSNLQVIITILLLAFLA